MARFPFQFTPQDLLGKTIVGATVAITLTDTDTVAIIYDAKTGGSVITGGILTSDSVGAVKFWVDQADYGPTQFFRATITGSKFVAKEVNDIVILPITGGLASIVEDTTPQLGGDLDLNGKNIDFPTTANISDCLDEDNMVSDSATMLATQQSIKAYADTKLADIVTDVTPQLGAALDTNAFAINESEGAAVVAATTTDIFGGDDGNTLHITGNTQIDDFTDASSIGQWRKIVFDGTPQLTSGSGITVVGGTQTMAAGDIAFVYADAVDAFRAFIMRADGTAVVSSGVGTIPAFHVNLSGDQVITTATLTTLTLDTEVYDTNTDFASNAFTPTVAGKYLLLAFGRLNSVTDQKFFEIGIYENTTTAVAQSFTYSPLTGAALSVVLAVVVDANGSTDDYIVRVQHNEGGNLSVDGNTRATYFQGFKIAE